MPFRALTPTLQPAQTPVPLGFQPASVAALAAAPTVENAPNMPFGLAFVGTAWSEAQLLGFAYAYEQATQTRLQKRAYEGAVPRAQVGDFVGRGYSII